MARGKIAGTANAPFLEIAGTSDRYALISVGQAADFAALIGKTVDVQGLLPQASKGKIPDTMRYKSIVEVK